MTAILHKEKSDITVRAIYSAALKKLKRIYWIWRKIRVLKNIKYRVEIAFYIPNSSCYFQVISDRISKFSTFYWNLWQLQGIGSSGQCRELFNMAASMMSLLSQDKPSRTGSYPMNCCIPQILQLLTHSLTLILEDLLFIYFTNCHLFKWALIFFIVALYFTHSEIKPF